MSENLPLRQPVTVPPMQAAEWEGELPSRLLAAFPQHNLQCRSYLGQHFIELPAATVFEVIRHLKTQEQFDTLTDLTAVDRPNDEKRFEIIYILYSFPKNERLRLKARIDANTELPSIVELYPGANWMEREVFDMFGVRFAGHPHLTRILMPEDWQGFPLRKDVSILAMDNDWVRQNLGIESGQ